MQAPGAGARHPQARHGSLREGDRDPVTIYRHISAERAHCNHPVSLMCELLGRLGVRLLGVVHAATVGP